MGDVNELRKRIKKLELVLGGQKVHWRLKDGREVESYSDDIVDCLGAAIRSQPHPLLEKIREADLSTYTGDDSLLGLIQAFLQSRERYETGGVE
jgi:hypothetical protein